MSAILHQLNPQQKEAVVQNNSHLLVVAGAGSGKTRVLTRKIAYLIEQGLAMPSQILAMTFSNKAAHEMKERVSSLLSQYQQPYWIGTFHSICLRILREHGHHMGLDGNFSVYDTSDQLAAIKSIMAEKNIDPKAISPKLIAYHLDQAKNESTKVVSYIQNSFDLGETIIGVVEAYEALLIKNQALDFGGLLGKTLVLLQEHEQVRQSLQHKWQRILIDEYQDTNSIQKALIQHLAGDHNIVCAVGDEDQSIYGWRGARVENMLNFPIDFPGAKVVKLEQNYRSSKPILEVANKVISHNLGRRKKKLWTDQEQGSLVEHFHADTDYQEAAFVLDKVDELLEQEHIAASEIAIFYRTHVQSRLLEEECRRRNQAYAVLGGTKFYDRKEIKDTLCYLRLLVNPNDDISFLRVVNTPSRGIGKTAIAQLNDAAEFTRSSLYQAIPVMEGNRKAHKAIREFHFWFEALRIECEHMDILDVAETVLDKSEYRASLEREQTIEAQARIENIEELLRSMQEYAQANPEHSLSDYLAQISLVTDMDNYDQEQDAITMMTIHNSKGLEYDAVFIVGMEEGVFPHKRALEDGNPDEIEEERRLCYVAMTRARKRLFLSSSSRRHLYKNLQHNPVARFIDEIPSQYLVHVNEHAGLNTKASFYNPEDGYSVYTRKKTSSAPLYSSKNNYSSAYEDVPSYQVDASYQSPYNIGSKVLHPKFGNGTIKNIEGNPDNLKLTIYFPSRGSKKILLNYCNLELLEK
ncbi:MAG TPA: UvrD-helicase domain-containing protein [Oligoflexia bacterium]|nr:UvrD-helicase domain-containing protein [Oligoflexia bacterium]HMR25402.1 UvrD-helicase domain-containing protein [Oligoflexia bacterium]